MGVTKGFGAVLWDKVGMIVASWFISPVMSLIIAAVAYSILKKFVVHSEAPYERATRMLPCFAGLTAFICALFVVYKGGKGIGLNKTDVGVAIGVSLGIGAGMMLLSLPLAGYVKRQLDR